MFLSLTLVFPPQKSAVSCNSLLKDATVGMDMQYRFINCPLDYSTNLNYNFFFCRVWNEVPLSSQTSYLLIIWLYSTTYVCCLSTLSQAFSVVIGKEPCWIQLCSFLPFAVEGIGSIFHKSPHFINDKICLLNTKELHPHCTVLHYHKPNVDFGMWMQEYWHQQVHYTKPGEQTKAYKQLSTLVTTLLHSLASYRCIL